MTNQVEKIFGKETGPSKSDRNENMRDSRNKLKLVDQVDESLRKDWEETIESAHLHITASNDKQKTGLPTGASGQKQKIGVTNTVISEKKKADNN